MRLVIKFGGVPVKDGNNILNAAKFAVNRHKKGDKVVVVTSAMAGVTDQLIEVAQKLVEHRSNPKRLIPEFMSHISSKHFQACRTAIDDKENLYETTRIVKDTLNGLERALTGISYLGELSARSQDLVMSFGERLSAPIIAGAIKSLGVPSLYLTGFEAGIVTDDCYTEARPLMDRTRKLVRQRLEKLLTQGNLPVVTGFVAGTAKGTVTTLGRGGSDYSASIVGAALKADEIWIMTDVDGIMTTDPKIEPSAKVIEVISYLEATELAYFGAKVLHPKTIQPAMELDIPVRVRNASKPEHEGTLIVRKTERGEGIVKAITASKKVSIITVSGAGMIGVPGVAAAVFDILGQSGVNVLMISQSSSQANISFAVERKDLDAALNSLRKGFSERHCDWTIEFDRDVSLIATVGAGMKGMPGVAARVFNTIGRNKINILMIAQGSSELNISFATDEHDAVKAVRALHGEFLSGRGR